MQVQRAREQFEQWHPLQSFVPLKPSERVPGICAYITYKHRHTLKGASCLEQPSVHDPGSVKDLMAYIYAYLSKAVNLYLSYWYSGI